MTPQPVTAQRHRTVVATTVMTLVTDGGDVPVDADLQFHTRDPFAVRMVFSIPGAAGVEWVFGRQLLVDGVDRPAGTGDVQLFPCEDVVILELDSPAGRARLLADRSAMTAFVRDTLDAVELGAEDVYFDIDREIDRLLAESLPGTALS
ncbi:SsgA family sporulation/cell division regulator [Nakamurella endophytica]|uniref:SsgA family sporulation/cell division regulator n=1 Tax=Nakamurella endophytica TaxID=1748367 RepID=A0A917WMA7_9ACTN|nr:SsgA family sporulation/cell division regulator [Nakamurella endophytica]GGM14018.1 hypothetical protein GCM10011594_37400 [Nakamurella endophytica]